MSLERFAFENKDRLEACAALSGRVRQLAASFPLAFFALATCYGPQSARDKAVALTEAGFPLKDIGETLGLPFALRRVPPEALACALTPARMNSRQAQALVDRLHNKPELAPRTLAAAFYGARICRASFGTWLARPDIVQRLPDDMEAIRCVALYAWHSNQTDHWISHLARRPWCRTLSWTTALGHTKEWLRRLKFSVYFDGCPIHDTWVAGGRVNGFDIVPLVTTKDFIDEAEAMHNCLLDYADRLRANAVRLFSVRQNGARVGTVEIRCTLGGALLEKGQFCGPRNWRPPLQAQAAVEAWWTNQNLPPSSWRPPAPDRSYEERFATILEPYLNDRDIRRGFWRRPLTLPNLSEELRYLSAPDLFGIGT